MAEKKSIDVVRSELEDALLDMHQVLETCDVLVGDSCPAWLFTMGTRFRRIDEATQAYMGEVHKLRQLVEVPAKAEKVVKLKK